MTHCREVTWGASRRDGFPGFRLSQVKISTTSLKVTELKSRKKLRQHISSLSGRNLVYPYFIFFPHKWLPYSLLQACISAIWTFLNILLVNKRFNWNVNVNVSVHWLRKTYEHTQNIKKDQTHLLLSNIYIIFSSHIGKTNMF